ncbi:hypothetical protein ACP70R_015750 [Stipagrostis hirtigluma subsp. patula]
MAAMRSALAMISRGSPRSSAAASMGRRGLEIHRLFSSAAPRTPPLPSLRPAAIRSHEGWRHFSTDNMAWADPKNLFLMKHKTGTILRMFWQRSRDSVKKAFEADPYKFIAVGCWALVCYLLMISRAIHHARDPDRTAMNTGPTGPTFYMIPAYQFMNRRA